MTDGLLGERRLLAWVERQAHESWFGPRLNTLEAAVPYASALLVYALLAAFGLRRVEDRWPALRAMAAGVGAWIVSDVLKLVVERPRPCLHQLSCGTHSFPEGPGMVFAAIAVAIWPSSRAIALVAAVCALADGAVQLAYGDHWPSDLLGAWVLGGMCGFIIPRAAERLSRGREEQPAGE